MLLTFFCLFTSQSLFKNLKHIQHSHILCHRPLSVKVPRVPLLLSSKQELEDQSLDFQSSMCDEVACYGGLILECTGNLSQKFIQDELLPQALIANIDKFFASCITQVEYWCWADVSIAKGRSQWAASSTIHFLSVAYASEGAALGEGDFGLVSIEHCMHVVGGLQSLLLCVICEF